MTYHLEYEIRRRNIPEEPSVDWNIPDVKCASSVKEAEYYTQWSPRHPLFTPWVGHPEFQNIYQGVEPYTLVTPERCHLLMNFAQHAVGIEGDFAECGVYRGGTALILARILQGEQKDLYLFDSFQGLPKENLEFDNYFRQGDFSDGSSEAIRELLQGVHDRVQIKKGWIPDSFQGLEDTRYAFVHIDTDLYQSALDCCEFFYPRLAAGGIMLFDDYGFPAC